MSQDYKKLRELVSSFQSGKNSVQIDIIKFSADEKIAKIEEFDKLKILEKIWIISQYQVVKMMWMIMNLNLVIFLEILLKV